MSDPERKAMKRLQEYIDRTEFVADAEYGIPTRCPCGGSILPEMSPEEARDFLPGKRFSTCNVSKDDGLHFRQPWVLGVEKEIRKVTIENEKLKVEVVKLTMRVAEMERAFKAKDRDM